MTTIDDYDLDTINIMLYNNIDRDKPVELTASMFIFDKPIKGDKIWICTNIRYSEEILMTKTHFECVQLFFDRNLLLNYAKESSIKKPNNIPADVRKISNDVKWLNSEMDSTCKLKHKNECFMKDNMLLVLKYCFPITFPVDNPPFSFSNGQHNVVTVSRLINGWFNSDKYANFTHMKIDGKSTTVIGCQWLDTIKFHPVYQKVNKNIKQYFVKVKEPLIKLLEQVMEIMEKSLEYTQTYTDADADTDKNVKKVSSNYFTNYYNLFYTYDNIKSLNNVSYDFKNKTMSKYKIILLENENDFKSLLQMIITNIKTNIDYEIIYKLFVIIYFFYYNNSQIKHSNETSTQYLKDITLTDILKLHNKKLKTSLDLILLLCCVFSKDGYNQFVRDTGIDQVTLQKYDFHKPYVQSFESLNLPNRKSTNKNLNALFDIIGYDITGLYDVYGENGYYEVAKKGETYIGFDQINLSADKKKAPHYEIYLAMEFAGGLVDDNNKSAVSCLFENNRLGRMLQKIIKQEKESEDVLEMREYIDLTDLIKKTEKEVKQKAAQEAQEAKVEKAEKAAKEAKEAKEAQQNPGPGQQNPGPQNQGSKEDLLEVELDKVPGISADIRKKIMDKINKDIPEVKELAKVISKYNKDVSLKSEYTKILTTTKSKIKSLIENAKYDEEQNKELTPDKKEKARYDLMDYEKIKELIIQMIDQTFFEENKDNAKKFKGGSLKGGLLKGSSLRKTRRRLHRRRHKQTRTL
jgi:hypothetical protein